MSETEFTQVMTAIAELRTLVSTEGMRCPYREDIGKAKNNATRITAVEEKVANIRIDFARQAGVGGSAGGIVAGALFVLGKLAGWWYEDHR